MRDWRAVPEEEDAPVLASQFGAIVVDSPVAVAWWEVAASLELSESTVFRWVRQDRIDRGELEGTSTAESAELRAANRRIVEWRLA